MTVASATAFDFGRDVVVTRRRLAGLARLLDAALVVPGTGVRFGLDAALGIVPVAGPVVTTAMSAYIILEAARLGVPRTLLARMAGNVALDALVSSIPVIGVVFDVAMRANSRNIVLLDRHLDGEPRRAAFGVDRGNGPVIDGMVVDRR
jgi:hypothetical protein